MVAEAIAVTALYRQVSRDILQQVQEGELKIGDKLPPETEYAAKLGISRSTLRLALAELERLGLVQRKKRAGTRIISDDPKLQFNMNTTGLYELLSLGRDTQLSITRTRTVAASKIAHLDGYGAPDDPWLEIAGTRALPDQTAPFNTTLIYVPARYRGIEKLLKPSEASIFQVIEDSFDVSVGRVSQTAKAIACPADAAAQIGIAPDAPALQIIAQLHARDGHLIEISVATFDPDRFQVRTDVEIE